MTIVIKILVFILGMYLSLRLIAALYGIIDLWYTIKTAYAKVIRGILGWGGITIAVAILLGSQWRDVFLWGIIAFLLSYLVNYILTQLVLTQLSLGKTRRPREIE